MTTETDVLIQPRGKAYRISWVAHGTLTYLDLPDTNTVEAAKSVIEKQPGSSPAYVMMMTYVFGGGAGKRDAPSSKVKDHYRRAKPELYDLAPELWESDPAPVPCPTEVDSFTVISAVGNHRDGWRVIYRDQDDWVVAHVEYRHKAKDKYQITENVKPFHCRTYKIAEQALFSGVALPEGLRPYDRVEEIARLDKIIEAEVFRTVNGLGRFEDRLQTEDIKLILDRRDQLRRDLKEAPADDTEYLSANPRNQADLTKRIQIIDR